MLHALGLACIHAAQPTFPWLCCKSFTIHRDLLGSRWWTSSGMPLIPTPWPVSAILGRAARCRRGASVT